MEWLVALTGIGCSTVVVLTFIDKVFGSKQKQLQEEVKRERERSRFLETQLADSHRLNDQLQKQLEWHTKMLETQDRLMKQLTDGSATREPAVTSR